MVSHPLRAQLLAGLAGGLDMGHAQRLATLLAAASVTSPHTIHREVSRAELAALAREMGWLEGPLGGSDDAAGLHREGQAGPAATMACSSAGAALATSTRLASALLLGASSYAIC